MWGLFSHVHALEILINFTHDSTHPKAHLINLGKATVHSYSSCLSRRNPHRPQSFKFVRKHPAVPLPHCTLFIEELYKVYGHRSKHLT